MQGWRHNQEDRHIAYTDGQIAVFGVFDGHGGPEVSFYVQEQFRELLSGLTEYKEANYGKALEKCFVMMDEKMCTDEGKERLSEIQD